MNSAQNVAAGAALIAVLAGGGAIAVASSAPPGTPARYAQDPAKGGHQANGITEQLLSGDTADRVRGAAIAANPGATVHRVENDPEGAVYEAHITKADGTAATVKLDATFTVTDTESSQKRSK
jgi:uncharacterized membrane protein YkoI